MGPARAIIFDCDGVLVDSEPLALEVMAEELGSLGLEFSDDEIHRRFTGRSLPDCQRIIEALTPDPRVAGFATRFETRLGAVFERRLRAVDGIHAVVATLASANEFMAVASSGSQAKIRRSLHLTGLARYFPSTRIFSAADVSAGKPAPDLFLHAARAIGVPPADCVVIEDSTPGLEAATAAGMRVIALLRPGTPPVEVPEGALVVPEPAMLAGAIAGPGRGAGA